MRIHQDEAICKEKVVQVVRLDTGEPVEMCIWVDDDDPSYEEIVMLPDGRISTDPNGRFVTRVVIGVPVKILIEDRPPPPPGYTYNP